MKGLYKTKIVIWTDCDPSCVSPDALAREADSGWAYCSEQRSEWVLDPEKDDDYSEGLIEFFWEDHDQ